MNAGMYAFRPEALGQIAGELPLDIGYHLPPHLVGQARAVAVTGYFRDIGTPGSYTRAQDEWPRQRGPADQAGLAPPEPPR